MCTSERRNIVLSRYRKHLCQRLDRKIHMFWHCVFRKRWSYTQQENDEYGILKGGDYFAQLIYMRTTCRFKTPKLERRAGVGFRCAK